MTQRQTRALRGVAATVVATLLAATAHTLSGGHVPPPWLVVTVIALASPVAVWLVGRRPSTLGTGAAVALAQAVLHTAFAVVGDASPALATTALHAHGSTTIPAAAAHAAVVPDGDMVFGHFVAALITAATVVYGERIAAAIARGLRRLVTAPVIPAPHITPRPGSAPEPLLRTAARVHLSALSRRGPPAHAC